MTGKMKSVLFLTACLAAAAPANARDAEKNKAYGVVRQTDEVKQIVDVAGDDGKQYRFFVTPGTEMEVKRKYWFDGDIDLSELKNGDWVEVEYLMTSPTYFVAKEIEVYRK